MSKTGHPIVPLACVSIRRARAADYEALCVLYDQLDSFHREARPDVFVRPEGSTRTLERVTSLIDSDKSAIFVAERGGAIAGFATLIEREMPDIPVRPAGRYAELDELVVSERHRRRGIARRLMRAGEEWATARGLAKLRIGVWAFNAAARALYESAGYEVQTLRLERRL